MDDLSQLAVGFANGAVTVIRGDLIHDRGARQRTVFESEEPITGVEFRDVEKVTTLYISTTGRILKLVLSGRGQGQAAKAIEDVGCGVGCLAIDQKNGDLVVARDDAVYYYNNDVRGMSIGYDGTKSQIKIYQDYIAVVSPPAATTTNSKSNALRRFGATGADNLFSTSTFTLMDTDLKIIAHSESMVSQPSAVFTIWGDLFVLLQDGKVGTLILHDM